MLFAFGTGYFSNMVYEKADWDYRLAKVEEAFAAAQKKKGTPPSAIVATKYVDDDPAKGAKTSRPLCPHPQVAKYKGQGDPNEAGSFACAPPVEHSAVKRSGP